MTLNGAIMQLVEMRENSMMPVAFKPYFDKVIETISECVEPSEIPQWIPCSERLPKDDRCVLITCEWDDVEIGWYDGEWRSEHCVYDDSDIVAWMPLPEPYKGGEQDG